MSSSGAAAPPSRIARSDAGATRSPRSRSSRSSAVGTSEAKATSPASIAAAAAAASKRSWSTTQLPSMTERSSSERPPTWKSGRQASQRSPSRTPRWRRDASALARRFDSVSITPFGRPVVPEV
jgi:hypothetical protein